RRLEAVRPNVEEDGTFDESAGHRLRGNVEQLGRTRTPLDGKLRRCPASPTAAAYRTQLIVTPWCDNGGVSDEIGELRMVEDAFDRPTLRLLHGKYAAVRVAVLRALFDSERRSIPTDILHVRVGALVDTFRENGIDTPEGTGRDLCRNWMRGKWLQRLPAEDAEGEVYELSASAVDALRIVSDLSSERVLLSESRLTAIVEAVRRQATEASPDVASKVVRIDAEIDRLTAERDRLLAGGEPEPTSVESMLEGYINLMDLIGQLPSDFKRVEEGVRRMRELILDDFRGDTRPLGQIIDEYLARSENLFATPEGRAFDGALALLRDEALLHQLKADLDIILNHPFTDVLEPEDIRVFRGTVTMVRRGLNDVIGQRSRITRTLKEHIVSRDAIRERELSAVFKALDKELPRWASAAPVRATCPVDLIPQSVPTLPHVRERFYDPADHLPPEPLAEHSDDGTEPLSLDELRRQGGPVLGRLQAALVSADSGIELTAGTVFELMDVDAKRPVEVLGLLHLLARATVLSDAEDREPVETHRTDGTSRRFAIPRVTLNRERVGRIAEVEVG
ncbi:MAG TPA: DUF3375 family protein, partial [Microthrixaceae bacterium]|nr:DUF3375 family protein [Microthrixaceae bacterium]